MPGLGRYPCESCRYVASSRRMLARHFALVHSKKVFKCPLCPFITRYAANWYRHKRDLHGLTKFTSCETCGFFANSTEELAEHKETEHPESLQLQKYQDKYHREKERLSLKSENSEVPDVENPFPVRVKEEPPEVENEYEEQQNNETASPKVVGRNYLFEENTAVNGDSVQFSLPLNGNLLESDSGHPEVKPQSSNKAKMNYLDPSNSMPQMSPLKVRRSYNCESCGLLTTNPREFLYHQRDVHKEKMNIHECKFCIYASKHIQKLQRHCDLVHRGQAARLTDGQKNSKNVKPKTDKRPPTAPVASAPLLEPLTVYNFPGSEYPSNFQSAKPVRKRQNPDILHCSACSYQTRNKMLLSHHEKTMHMKKKFYRCPQCGYVTNEKARFTKHIKYHNLPKMKCEFCHFRTAYKWNMDRHVKNHEMGAAGEYNCLLCSFITKSKQSLKLHVTKHHEQDLVEGNDEGDEDEEIEVVECDEAEFNANHLGWNESPQDQNYEPTENEPLADPEGIGYSGDQNSDTVWKQGKLCKRELKCQSCDFTTSWPFELKKHEEVHKSSKKHSCPLCGMRFEHVAWLSKHLCRVHKDNAQALDMAAALEVLKPNRRAPQPSQEQVNASFQSIIQQTETMSPPEPSLLSTLLNQSSVPPKSPDFLPYTVSKNSSPVSSEPQETYAGYSGMPAAKKPQLHSFKSKVKFSAVKRSCNLCNYKTRWSSELEKHMRTHSDHKPFPCSRCDFRSKWKGDLNRHMMKYHGVKIRNKNHMVPKLKLKKALSSKHNSGGSWQAVSQESTNAASSTGGKTGKDQESPLDLTVGRGTFPGSSEALNILSDEELELMDMTLENIEPIIPGNSYSLPEEASHLPNNDSSLVLNSDALNAENFDVSADELPTGYKIKKKYQCPFCTFNTGTPSRFHVHIVQHYNKRPFMCSECGLRSNWEWDITKHIRLKACKEKTHQNACVLLTDETGRRNYEKYDKYLTDVPVVKKSGTLSRISEGPNLEPINNPGNGVQFNVAKSYPQKKPVAEGGQHLNTNVEGAPVNIVVTPDIDMSFSQEVQESGDGFSQSLAEPLKDESSSAEKRNSVKSFYCKHCNYKNPSRKVVISHLTVHAGTRPFSCRVCGMSSNWRQVVVKHVKTSHNGYMNDVEERLKFVQEGHGIRLTSVTTNGTSKRIPPPAPRDKAQFGCKLCPYKCDKEFYIKFHMKQHKPREGANYKCAFCPYYVKFKKTLVRHMKLHSDPPASPEEESPTYTGSLPSRPFFTPESDNHNQRTQNYVKDNGASFNSTNNSPTNSNNDLLEVNSDTDDSIPVAYEKLKATAASIYDPGARTKRHVCKHCPYRTDNKTQFLYHKQFHRPNSTAPYRCSLCSYWATMQHLITQHMKIHRAVGETPKVTTTFQLANSPAKPLEEEEAASPDSNIRTVYVQRGDFVEKMFKCNFCPMMNKKRANVKVHQKNHLQSTEDGKFACNMCNYKCLSQGGLTNHMKMHVTMENTCEVQLPRDGLAGAEVHGDSKDPDASLNGVNYSSEGGIDIISRKKVFSYLCMRCPAVFKSSQDLQVHRSFHGSGLAFACPHCDYKAKHKPHLFKHLQVHSPDYLLKRGITRPPPIDSEKENSSEFEGGDVDPLLVQEASEVRNFLRKSRRATKKMHRCDMCPAAFSEITTLSYHTSLHGSNGQFGCSECNYSTVRSANLSLHAQLHSRILPSGHHVRVFHCPKCPASFQKRSRYDNHLNLHGRNYKYACDRCDYSVRFAANLTKHKLMHNLKANQLTSNTPEAPASVSNQSLETYEQRSLPSPSKLREISRNAEAFDDKKAYVCDRCPYYQPRKDAVLSHMRRHSANDRCKCPYCDYSTSQSFFLRDHVKTHLQPSPLYAPEAYMRCKSFQIYVLDGDKRTLVFEDKGPKYNIKDRFYPPCTEGLDVDDDDTDISEVSYTRGEVADQETSNGLKSENSVYVDASKNRNIRNRSHCLSSTNSEISGRIKQKALLAKCKQFKIALVDFVAQRETVRKMVSPQDFYLISKALKKNKKSKQRLLKNSKKQLKISSYKAFASGFGMKSKLKTKSKEEKLWRKKAKKSDDSKKSSIVVKIKVDNAEKPSEVTTQNTPMSEDDNCSDAASDVTIPVDDFMEDCSMEDDSSFSNPGPPPSSVSENSKNEDISISSVLSNGSSIKLNKCSVAVEMLKLDRAVKSVKNKQFSSDNVTQDALCSFDRKEAAGGLTGETSASVFAGVGMNRQSSTVSQKSRDHCNVPMDDNRKLSAGVFISNSSDKSADLRKGDCKNIKINQCSVSVKPLTMNQSLHSSPEVSVNMLLSGDEPCPPNILLSPAKHFHNSNIYTPTAFSDPSRSRKDENNSIPFEALPMMAQTSEHLVAVEPHEPDGCCLKIESVQTIASTSPFNGNQKWPEDDQDTVGHLVMNHLHGDMGASSQNDIFVGHPTQMSSASALAMNYGLGQSDSTLIDSKGPICLGEYSSPIVSSQQCHPTLKIVEVVGANAFPENLGCTAGSVVSEMNACRDLQLTESSSRILPEHWTKMTSSHDFNSVMETDPVLNGCLSNLQVENEVPLEILL